MISVQYMIVLWGFPCQFPFGCKETVPQMLAVVHFSWSAIGMSLEFSHLGAENKTQKFRISLSVSDTVVITGPGVSLAS